MANEVRINVTADTDQAEKSIGGLGQTLGGVGKIASGFLAANVVQNAVGSMVSFSQDSIKAATSLGESLNAVNVVFKESAGEVLDWGKNNATQFGLSQRAFNEMATPLGAMLKNSGMSMDATSKNTIDLTKRAADMASVFNTDVKDALGAITAGLRGEVDPLERYGVKLSAAAVEARALADSGKSSAKALTDQELAAARVALIFEQTNSVAGDFKNTSDGLANSQRISAAKMEELQAQVGEKMMPAMLALTKVKMRLAEFIVDILLPAIEAIGKFFTEKVMPAFEDFKKIAGPVIEQFAGIAKEQFDKFKTYYEESIKPALENIGALVKWVIEKFQEYWPKISQIVGPVIDQVQLAISTAFEVITGIIDVFIKLLGGDFSGAWNAIKDIVKSVIHYIKESIGNLVDVAKGFVSMFFEVGEDIIRGFLDGLKNMWWKVVNWIQEKMDSLPAAFKKVLGIASPSKVFKRIGEQTMEGLELGLKSGGVKVGEFLDGMSMDMGVNLSGNAGRSKPGTSGGNISIYISGIVTDPVATGRAVADALNAAANQTGALVVSGAIQ